MYGSVWAYSLSAFTIRTMPTLPIALHPALMAYVEEICFDTNLAHPSPTPVPYPVFPSPWPVLGIQYRGRLRAMRDGNTLLLSRSGITGLQSTARWFAPERETGTILIRFKPYGAFAMLGAAMSELTDAHVPLAALLPSSWSSLLEEQLGEAENEVRCAQIVQRFLLHALEQSARATHPTVVEASQRLLMTHGALRVSEVARECAISRRQLERLFRMQIGVGPKEFADVARFQWTLTHAPLRTSWGALAYDAGYADQSHLIRSFTWRAGMPPEAFFARA